MSITRSRTSIENRYSLKGHILEEVKEVKYLGGTLHRSHMEHPYGYQTTRPADKIDGNHKDTVICQKYWEM